MAEAEGGKLKVSVRDSPDGTRKRVRVKSGELTVKVTLRTGCDRKRSGS
jgi:hypothetical protein